MLREGDRWQPHNSHGAHVSRQELSVPTPSPALAVPLKAQLLEHGALEPGAGAGLTVFLPRHHLQIHPFFPTRAREAKLGQMLLPRSNKLCLGLVSRAPGGV